MSGRKVKCSEVVLRRIVHPPLDSLDLADCHVFRDEVVLPAVLEDDLEAVRLVAVGGVGKQRELLGVYHVDNVDYLIVQLQELDEAFSILVGDEVEEDHGGRVFYYHAWL